MLKKRYDDWRASAEAIQTEADPVKLSRLVRELRNVSREDERKTRILPENHRRRGRPDSVRHSPDPLNLQKRGQMPRPKFVPTSGREF